ncbi:hypothetical protein AB6D11_02925 [Vibrio splendidus]
MSNSIREAKLIFSKIINELNIGHLKHKDEPSLNLSIMNQPDAYLGYWMLRADELSVMMTDQRLWATAYIGRKDSVIGFVPVEINELAQNPEYSSGLETYLSIPTSEENLIAKHAYCRLALQRSLKLKENSFDILPLAGFYNTDGAIKPNQLIPFVSQDMLLAFEWNNFCVKNQKIKELTPLLSLNEQDLSPEQANKH